MKKMSTKMLVEAGLMIALAQILSYVKIFESYNGGSITLGSMVPIIIFSLRWGGKHGLIVGLTYGILQFLLGAKYSFHPLSILLDYLLPFASLGLAGFFTKNIFVNLIGVTIATGTRFVFHFLSGIILWASYAPEGMNAWLYSLVYNGAFMLPEFIITAVIVGLIYVPLKRFISPTTINN